MTRYCDWIFYADESGDHSLTSVDFTYPIFALSVCGFRKSSYCSRVVPNFQRLKFEFFGHDAVVLHEKEIRRQENDFRIFFDRVLREKFLLRLEECISKCTFKIFPCIIDKRILAQDLFAENPYSVSLNVVLCKIYQFLERQGCVGDTCHFVFEKRGKKEDNELELEFRRIVSGRNLLRQEFKNLEIRFSDKRANSTGMQLADLTARPLGLGYLRSSQENRALNVISKKVYRGRKIALGTGVVS